jgi:hypothetical protein
MSAVMVAADSASLGVCGWDGVRCQSEGAWSLDLHNRGCQG